MTSIVKRLSIVVIIIAAAILVYGFIDAGSYRDGYKAGYDRISRSVDAACVNGFVSDTGLCVAAEAALYADAADAILGLTAQASDSILGTSQKASAVTSAPAKSLRKKRTLKKSVPASPQVVVSADIVPPTVPATPLIEITAPQENPVAPVSVPPPPPPTEAEIKKAKALASDCAGAGKNREKCEKEDPYCVMSITKRDGSGAYVNTDYTAGCTDSEVKLKRISFDPKDPCSQADVQARMPRARMVTGTSGEKICSDNSTFLYLQEDKSSGQLVPFGDKGSVSELLRSPGLKEFAQKTGAKAVVAPIAPVTPASTPTPAPMYQPPGGYYMPMGGGYTPPHASIYKPLTFANLIDAFVGLFRRVE